MKESIEHSIKNSLENYELPYNADAWKAMSSKLDAVKPVKKPPYKWYIAASAAVVLSACAYLYYTQPANPATTQDNKEIAQKESNPTSTTNIGSETEQTSSSSTFTTSPDSDQSNDQGGPSVLPSDPSGNLNVNNPGETDPITDPTSVDPKDPTNPSDPKTNDPGEHKLPTINFTMPAFSNALCQGVNMKVSNTNDVDVTIVYPNGTIWTGKKNSTTTLNPNLEGTYQVGYLQDKEFIREGSFSVLPKPSSGFEFIRQDEKYDDKALPATYVEATGIGTSYEWKFGQATAEGKEATAHFFKKGTHTVELTVTDANGCRSTTEKIITVDEQYNLMAMKAFAPTDIDPANNTFMPFALTQRGDDFHMIIIDPTDGHLIYETRDASKGWDGIDKQNGSMAPYEKAYIWKVTIENRMIGESPEYAGTVVLMKNRR
jgi:hypothetical protein